MDQAQINKIILKSCLIIFMQKTTKKARFKAVSAFPQKKQVLPLPYIELTLSTWQKDSHGLFDYQANANMCEVEVFNITKSSKIYRHVTTMRVQIIDDNDTKEMPVEFIYIATVIIDRETQTFKIQSAAVSGVEPHEIIKKEHPDIFNNSFLAIKSFQKEEGVDGYPLMPGNVVRLGRVEYVVLEIRNETSTEVYKQTSHLELNTGNYVVQNPLTGSCKICLCEQSTQEDPLISPCLCKGSCQFIHVGCLKNWINSKVKKQLNDIVLSYNFSKFECEICKAPFPKTVTMEKGDLLQMITIEKQEKPYIMLETVNNKQDNKKQRNLHMIFSNEGAALKVGRGHQCEMRVNDISVSRTHAEVRFENNKFYIKDIKSKFGTLIKFKEQFNIKDGMMLQYGRVCLGFTIKKEQPKQRQDIETMEDDDANYY